MAQSDSALSDQIFAVLRETATARGLPNDFYVEHGSIALEKERIFSKTWSGLGFASDIPEPGDAKPVDWLGVPLLMVRDQKGRVHVHHNVCSHRGRQLLDGPCRLKASIRCPYHSWNYAFDGALLGTPHIGGVNVHESEGFDRAANALRSVPSAVWCDVVFVNLSGDAGPFEDFIAPVMARWHKYWGGSGPDELRSGAGDTQTTLDVASNWKLAVENYCESYHLPFVHPDLNSFSRLEDHYEVFDDDGASFAGQGTRVYNLAEVAGTRLPRLKSWPQALQREAEYLALYPNLLIGLQADHFFAVLLEPISEAHTREHVRLLFVGDGATDSAYAEAREKTLASWENVFSEDISMVEGMQRGRHSPAYQGGVFSPVMDGPTHHFHRWVARRLAPGDEPPEVLAG
ncbi:MAG: aromatic ring-hydroxylating dioxygenase subunit alpha [Spiribacter sp.]|nr:aromatic ring-hydroxylating dioxygenase subunit alpha [Spiribacter sp.]